MRPVQSNRQPCSRCLVCGGRYRSGMRLDYHRPRLRQIPWTKLALAILNRRACSAGCPRKRGCRRKMVCNQRRPANRLVFRPTIQTGQPNQAALSASPCCQRSFPAARLTSAALTTGRHHTEDLVATPRHRTHFRKIDPKRSPLDVRCQGGRKIERSVREMLTPTRRKPVTGGRARLWRGRRRRGS